MLSVKFPHLFLQPEIIIGDGSGVGGRCDTALRGILVGLLLVFGLLIILIMVRMC